jgi:hypothetical protein
MLTETRSEYEIDEHTPTLLGFLAEHGAQTPAKLAEVVGFPVAAIGPWLDWTLEAGLTQPVESHWAVTTKGRKAAVGR